MEPTTPVSPGLDLTPDLLATHGRALRGLACSLLGDAHAAEDVVQETWLACLERPGALPERVSAWLGTVTKHLALHRLRGDGRRELRELRAAAPERLEALQQRALERDEALRAVTQALLALEEPYKTALFLRFFEERSPRAIASELELPLSTVKSRIARGLERLRAKLGPEFGGDELRRTRALRALAGLPPGTPVIGSGSPASAAAATVGALALATKLQVAAAVALAGGALWWWSQAPVEGTELAAEPVQPQQALAALASSRPAQSPGIVPAQDVPQRESVATRPGRAEPEALDAFPAEASFPYRITGRVRDELDLPLPGARVFLGPHRFALNRVATTDEEGRFTFAFDARQPTFACVFTVDDGGARMLGLQELELVSGRELVVDVGLDPLANRGTPLIEMHRAEVVLSNQVRGTPTDPRIVYRFDGADEEVVAEAASVLRERARFALRSVDPLERAPEALRRPGGRGIFVDPPPSLACARPIEVEAAGTMAISLGLYEPPPSLASVPPIDLESARASMPFSGNLRLEAARRDFHLSSGRALSGAAADPSEQATLRGVVRDAHGNLVTGAVVCWARPGGAFEERTSTAEDGSFTLPDVAVGEVVVRAGGGDHGIASERLTLAPGQELAWNPALARGDEVTGRVCLFNARMGLARVLVELWSTSSSTLWCDATLTDEDGRFALPNVPPGTLALHVYASGSMNPPSAFPIRVVSPVLGTSDLGDILLAKDEVVTGSLAVTVLGPDGEPVPGAEVRVWQAATGRGVFASPSDEDGKLALAGLPVGSYRVEAGGPFGWRDLGSVWVDPWAEGVDLNEVRFPAPGLAQLGAELPSPDARAVLATLWSVRPDVFARVDERELGRAVLALRAGDYVLAAAAGKDRRNETAFTVRPGETSALMLEVSPELALVARPDGVDPALEAGARASSCSACHAGPTSGAR